MSQAPSNPGEITERGQSIYEEKIRPLVENDHHGKFLVIDISSGEYEIDESDVEAVLRLKARLPDAEIFGLRIGHKAAYRMLSPREVRKEC